MPGQDGDMYDLDGIWGTTSCKESEPGGWTRGQQDSGVWQVGHVGLLQQPSPIKPKN